MSVVTNTNDSGTGSLRQAIIDSNIDQSDITFTVTSGTITLVTTLPDSVGSYDVIGPGTTLAVDGSACSAIVWTLGTAMAVSGLRFTNSSYSFLYLSGSSTITVTACQFDNISTAGSSTSLYAPSPCTLGVYDCTFTSCTSTVTDGAMLWCNSIDELYTIVVSGNTVTSCGTFLRIRRAAVTFTGNTLTNCSTERGCGIDLPGGATFASTYITCEDNVFTNCTASNHSAAFGLTQASDITIRRNVFDTCTNGTREGGAMRLNNCDRAIIIESNYFVDCSATTQGGAWRLDSKPGLTSLLSRGNTYSNCSAATGGAIQLSGIDASVSFDIQNETFYYCEADDGGGLFVSYGESLTFTPRLLNCTFVGNLSATNAGAIRTEAGSFELVNCIFADNYIVSRAPGNEADIAEVSTGGLSGSYNLIMYPTNTGFVDGVDNNKIGTGYVPGLQSLAYNGGLVPTCAITLASDGFDAGDNSVASTYDARGHTRIQNHAIDMGAYEKQQRTKLRVTTW